VQQHDTHTCINTHTHTSTRHDSNTHTQFDQTRQQDTQQDASQGRGEALLVSSPPQRGAALQPGWRDHGTAVLHRPAGLLCTTCSGHHVRDAVLTPGTACACVCVFVCLLATTCVMLSSHRVLHVCVFVCVSLLICK